MTRILLALAIITTPLAVQHAASGRSPDKVAHSPIPSLQIQQQRRPATSVQSYGKATWRSDQRAALILPSAESVKLLPTDPNHSLAPSGQQVRTPTSAEDNSEDYRDEKLQLWNSPEMRAAREFVLEFCRRSAQTSLLEGQHFLEQLSQLSASEMRQWLTRFEQRRSNTSRGQDVESLARRLVADRAISRQQARRLAAAQTAELRKQAIAAARQQQTTTPQLSFLHRSLLESTLQSCEKQSFNPLEVTIDPSSPRGYRRRVAAAMGLPGDLPRGDPRNYIRGETGVDFGEWANTRGGQPPSFTPPIFTPVAVSPSPSGE